MSSLSDLRSAQSRIESFHWSSPLSSHGLAEAIDDALAPPSPDGSPDAVEQVAEYYTLGSSTCDSAAGDIKDIGTDTLPNAWRGVTGETAAQAVVAVSSELTHMKDVLAKAADALNTWALELRWAQTHDRQGVALLKKAKDDIGWQGLDAFGAEAAQEEASAGVGMRIAAVQHVQDASAQATSALNQLASQARAERILSGDVDALGSLELANTTNPGGYAGVDAADVLTETQLSRGSAQLDRMSAADRTEFEQLLAESVSPQEAAYLWKALAAGHNMAELRSFQAAIHPWGGDPYWLAEHLTPALSSAASAQEDEQHPAPLSYRGVYVLDNYYTYSQGKTGDCVSASTVVAQLSMDPVSMLKMTTGGTADGDDSADAFHKRLDNLYVSEYQRGRAADRRAGQYYESGVTGVGATVLANSDLGKVDGGTYSYTALGDAEQRSAAIDGIDQAVDSGKPVPISTWDGKHPNDGHHMMIIGRDGDKLEVYNPWGYTQWVSDSDFVNDRVGMLTSKTATGGEHIVRGVEIPQ